MNRQDNAINCFVCGTKNHYGLHMNFYETDDEPVRVVSDYSVPDQFQGFPGIVHGGVVAAMLDEVAFRTVFRGNPPRYAVTARLLVRYRKPVPVSTPLRLMGRIVEDKGNVIKVASEIFDPNESLYAEADVVLMEVDRDFFPGMTDDIWGWKTASEKSEEE